MAKKGIRLQEEQRRQFRNIKRKIPTFHNFELIILKKQELRWTFPPLSLILFTYSCCVLHLPSCLWNVPKANWANKAQARFTVLSWNLLLKMENSGCAQSHTHNTCTGPHRQTELVPEDVMLLQIQEDCTCQQKNPRVLKHIQRSLCGAFRRVGSTDNI